MRKPWFWNLLLAVGVMVAVARLAGYWRQPLPSLPAAPEPPPAASPVGQLHPSALAEEDYGVIVSRNLFSPIRSVAPPSPSGEAPAPAPAAPPPKITLYGVVIEDGGEKTAYLKEDSQGQGTKPRAVREGDTVSGGKVSAIGSNRVTLVFGGKEVIVPLRSPKGKVAAPPRPPVAAPPRPSQPPRLQPPGRSPAVRRPVRRPFRSRARPSRTPSEEATWGEEPGFEEEYQDDFRDQDFPEEEEFLDQGRYGDEYRREYR